MYNERLDSLNFAKVEGDLRKDTYIEGLHSAIDRYSIKDSSFRNPKQAVLEGASRLLSGYDVDPSFVSDSERTLIALAVTDSWMSTKDLSAKKSLLDVLKLAATGTRKDVGYGSYSGRVRLWSEYGNPRGSMFDPEAQSGNHYTEFMEKLDAYVDEHLDAVETAKVTAVIRQWGPNTKLDSIRNRLGIYSVDEENPFDIVVLAKSANELVQDIGYSALVLTKAANNGARIILNSDYEEHDSFEHEYVHTQGPGMTIGYQHHLFRGLNEALTEGAKLHPATYPAQRAFLRRLLRDDPSYEYPMYQTYRGYSLAKDSLYTKMISDYGLEGFLTIARMAPIDNPKLYGGVGTSVYIAPFEAWEILKVLKWEKEQMYG
ncbi:hypothetical protein KAZ57_01065 [Patescibacteria group bacterium]|nr:hypothetical protein [Patescibacteria group bacterium]